MGFQEPEVRKSLNYIKKTKQFLFSNAYLFILMGLLVSSFIVQKNNFILTNSLDTSWMFTINYASSHNFIFGKDIIFTFGPLGFLGYPITEGLNQTLFYISCILKIVFLLYLGLIVYDVCSTIRFLKVKELVQLMQFILLPWLVIKMGFYVDYTIFIFLALVHSALVILTNFDKLNSPIYSNNKVKLCFILFNGVSCAMMLFVKVSFLPIIIAIFFVVFISFYISKSIINSISYLLSFLLTFSIIYIYFNTNLSGYISNSLEIISGYKKSMQIFSGEEYWKYFSVGILITLLFLHQLYKIKSEFRSYEKCAQLFLILVSFYYCFSYSFTRGSASLFFKCSIISILISFTVNLIVSNESKRKISLIMVLVLSFGFFNLFYNDIFFLTNWSPVKYLDRISSQMVNKKETYDVYPNQTSLCYFNNLNYLPRPIFQSYSSYTLKLDSINTSFYKKTKVDNIIFHTSLTNSSWGNTIDERYFLFEEPATKMEILKNYSIKYNANSNLFITSKRQKCINIKMKPRLKRIYSLGSLINLESLDTTKLYFFTANFNYSTKAKLASLVYKYPYLSVELTKTDNKTVKFNTVSDLLKHYSVLNKYCSNYYDYFSLVQGEKCKLLKNVKAIRFVSNQRGYIDKFEFSVFEASLL